MVPITQLGTLVHSLPASESGAYCGAGALFRLCLEMAFYCQQATAGAIFSGHEGSEGKRLLESRWQYATFLAGLMAESHRVFAGMLVTTPADETWPPYEKPLLTWLEERKAESYFVRWVPGAVTNPAMTAMLLNHVVPKESLQYLRDGAEKIVQTLIGTITQTIPSSERSTLNEIVRSVRQKLLARDVALQPASYGKATVGVTIAPHIIDVLRTLVTEDAPAWACNSKRAIVWYGQDGMFLVWRTAAKQVTERLKLKGILGVPSEPDTQAEILIGAGYATKSPNNDLYWPICPPGQTGKTFDGLKILRPEALFGETPLPPIGNFRLAAVVDAAAGDDEDQALSSVAEAAQAALQRAAAPIIPSVPSTPVESTPTSDAASSDQDLGVGLNSTLKATDPEDLLRGLGEKEGALVAAVRDDVRSGRWNGKTQFSKKTGLVIQYSVFDAYGFDPTRILLALDKVGWIIHNPDKKGAKLTPVMFGDKKEPSVVMPAAIALTLGFVSKDSA